jgi:hypothetical protein
MSKDGNSSGGDDWMSKLAGKKIGEQHDETVGCLIPISLSSHGPFTTQPAQSPHTPHARPNLLACLARSKKLEGGMLTLWSQTFAKTDLPKEHRVLKPDSMQTMDFKPDRLNIHVGDDGVVNKVSKG